MACLMNKRVVNPRYKKIAPDRHFYLYHSEHGLIPKQDYYINVDCGRCINCFRKYMSAWRFRLIHECLSLSPPDRKRSFYVTLTIAPAHYTEKKPLLKKMVRLFLERVRKRYKKSIKHFLVTERGEKFDRLHFHGFFFNTDVPSAEFANLWKYGFVKIYSIDSLGDDLVKAISYCTSYVTKGKKGVIPDVIAPENYPLVLVSPRLGISYVDYSKGLHTRSTLFPLAYDLNGKVRSLPRYLRQKVFNEDQLKLLKDEYFNSIYDDVIPEGPYFIGNKRYTDYTLYLKDLIPIQQKYNSIYGK